MRDNPKPLQVYKHFKGTYYQVLTVAKHSETGDMLVIYKALFGSDQVYARPLEMFLSEVDHDKYPDVKQKWRFALATGQGKRAKSPESGHEKEEAVMEEPVDREEGSQDAEAGLSDDTDEDIPKTVDEGTETDVDEGTETDADEEEVKEAGEDDFLDKFLDADTYEEKLDIFTDMWKTINENNIDNVATIMDLNLTGETLEEKYKEILSHLKMRARYESSRLR